MTEETTTDRSTADRSTADRPGGDPDRPSAARTGSDEVGGGDGAQATSGGDRRVGGLDVARGLLLVASVAGSAVLAPVPDQLVHGRWFDLRFWDVVFPMFVTLSGCGMAFLFRRGVRWRRNLRRALVLLAAGLLYNVVAHPGPLSELRYLGPLQVYALLVLLIGSLHLVLRTARAWAVFTVVYALVLTLLWWWFAQACPGGVPRPRCNPTLDVESALFGMEHLYRQGGRGFEPEGVVGTLGALVTAAAGVTAGQLVRGLGRTRRAANALLGWAVVVGALGWALTLVVPAVKWIWTPSFGLMTAALGVALAGVSMWLVDAGPGRDVAHRLSYPLRALGRNSLLVYFGSHILVIVLGREGEPAWSSQIADAISPWGHPRATFALAALLAWTLLAVVLDRRRIYVKA